MNHLAIFVATTLAFSTTALAQDADQWSDPAADTQGVDTSSSVDRQAAETYRKNSLPPVPAAPLPIDRPADMRPKIITGSADRQAAETYRANAVPPVPSARNRGSNTPLPAGRHHRRRHHRHVAGNPQTVEHRADHAIVEPMSNTIAIPPRD